MFNGNFLTISNSVRHSFVGINGYNLAIGIKTVYEMKIKLSTSISSSNVLVDCILRGRETSQKRDTNAN